MKNKTEKPKRPYKAARVTTLIFAILIGAVAVLFAMTFGSMFVVGGTFLTTGDGIMKLFLVPLSIGQRPIKEAYMAMAVSPGLAGLIFALIYVIFLRGFFSAAGKEGKLYFKKGTVYFICMTVTAVLWSAVPRILSTVFASQVARSGYFEIKQWNPIAYIVLAVFTLAIALIYSKKAKSQNEAEPSETTEAKEGDTQI